MEYTDDDMRYATMYQERQRALGESCNQREQDDYIRSMKYIHRKKHDE